MNRHLKIGVGGKKCVCCFPAPRSKARRLAYRLAKKLASRAAFKCEEENK